MLSNIGESFFSEKEYLSPCDFISEQALCLAAFNPLSSSSLSHPSSLPLSSSVCPPRGTSGKKRPALFLHKVTPEEEEDIKRKRLARKAELARVNRKRKKERIEYLEKQVSHMQSELVQQRKCNQANALRTQEPAVAAVPPGDAVPSMPGQYMCSVAVNNTQQSQLTRLQSAMRPCLFSRFLQWILTQENQKFYCDPTSLWFGLFLHKVGVSVLQFDHLLKLRQECLELSTPSTLPGSSVIGQAFESLRRSLRCSTYILETFMQILTPPQLIVFYRWVERHGGAYVT